MIRPEDLLRPTPQGLYCPPGDFYIDPVRGGVDRAVVTHGHSDHARAGHGAVLATPETLEAMATRYGDNFTQSRQSAPYGVTTRVGDVDVRLVPAGHVIGSAQVEVKWKGLTMVCTGDYKRRADPTCAPFVPVPCDLFITEATFGLPVFRHPPAEAEIARLLESVALFPERCHVVGAYALGKAQRVIAELRAAGWDRPVYLHGALQAMCGLYERHGVALGPLLPATTGEKGQARAELAGSIVIAPPGAVADRWARRLPDPLVCVASGWMRVRQRAKAQGVELPLVISDHADWDELLATFADVGAGEVWVTHGREEALVHAAAGMGIRARALALVGYDEEGS